MFLKPLFILFISLVFTETIIMLLLAEFADENLGTMVPVIFDAIVVSLVTISVIKRLIKKRVLLLPQNVNAEFIAFEIGMIVFTLEVAMMWLLDLQPFNLNDWQLILLDVSALSFLSVVSIYFILSKLVVVDVSSQTLDIARFEPTIITSILIYMCFAILLLMALFSSYQKQLQQSRLDIIHQESNALSAFENAFLTQLHHTSRDLLILASDHNVHAFLNGALRKSEALEQYYRNIVTVKSYYAQIRVLNTQGKEMIRVERNDKQMEAVVAQQLQDKSDRYYFKESKGLDAGQIYISPLDLNIEQGKVELPINPMVRLATPIVDNNGIKLGIVIINLRGSYLLNVLADITESSHGKVMLLNSDGYWLFGGEEQANWAFMFDDKLTWRFQRDYPDIWQKITTIQQGEITTERMNVIVQSIDYSTEIINEFSTPQTTISAIKRHWPVWKLISLIPSQQLTAQLKQTRKIMTILYFFMLFLGAFIIVLFARAIISRRKYEAEVQKLAFRDHLTGLYNRRLFSEKMDQEVVRARREENGLALMYFDLDYFKTINDELGHAAGDEALKEAAKRLTENLREWDILARIGGDEFAALLPKPGGTGDITEIAKRIIDSFEQPFELSGYSRRLGVSIGIAIQLDPEESDLSLIKRADHAMYKAKRAGRNCFKFSQEAVFNS